MAFSNICCGSTALFAMVSNCPAVSYTPGPEVIFFVQHQQGSKYIDTWALKVSEKRRAISSKTCVCVFFFFSRSFFFFFVDFFFF